MFLHFVKVITQPKFQHIRLAPLQSRRDVLSYTKLVRNHLAAAYDAQAKNTYVVS